MCLTRILLYTGKGGVGKTSVAAATAVLCARRGIRTLVVSTDIAHSLADALDAPVGPTPRQIAANLWAHEPDVFFNISRYWKTIQAYFSSLFQWGGLDEVMAEEMTVLPGMDELGNLLWIGDHVDEGQLRPDRRRRRADRRDGPPAQPARGESVVDREIAPIGRRVQRLGGPMLRRVVGVPLPSDAVYEAGEELLSRLQATCTSCLSDPDRSSVRLVLNLERVSIQEAQRSFTYFHMYGFPTDLIVANRVLPVGQRRLLRRLARGPGALSAHGRGAVRAGARCAPSRSSIRRWSGLSGSQSWARHFSATAIRDQFLYRGRPYSISRDDGGYTLSLELPFATREEISLSRSGDELVLQVGAWRRNLVLPRLLLDAPTQGAKMEDKVLKVRFGEPTRAAHRQPGR